ncbi:MAG: hypothetical protein IJ666_07435 [Ruminococcus sp.]|nr:hypothetical protein [Ruminococcus sp.]
MIELEKFVGNKVHIECTDGKIYEGVVDMFSDATDNIEPEEDGIGICIDPKQKGGIFLYQSDIKNIEIID